VPGSKNKWSKNKRPKKTVKKKRLKSEPIAGTANILEIAVHHSPACECGDGMAMPSVAGAESTG
jgi:hypothetical protein